MDRTREVIELETLLTGIMALAPENGGTGEMEKASALLEWLEGRHIIGGGAPCEVERFDAPDDRVPGGKRPNVVITLRGTDDAAGAVWVISHLDVVGAGDVSSWATNPWQAVEKDGVIYGRGTEDDQAGIVSSVIALMDVIASGERPKRTVKLCFASDEEVGSKYGIGYLLRKHNLFHKEDIIIIPDGGDAKGETIEVAEKGILWLRFTVTGLQSHASRPDMGRNACLASSDLSLRLHALESVFDEHDALFTPDYSTFSPTMRFANVDSVNIIPAVDVFCIDCRVLPCYGLDEVMAAVDRCCREVEASYDVKVSYETLQRASSPATSVSAPVVKMLSRALMAVHGITARTIGIGGGTVAAELRNKGFDAAVWSTIEDTAHMPNERAVIKSLLSDADTLHALFIDACD